ncbi:MAG TPA: hypothetical protein VJ900_02125 [Patescibacteria group bacterium]|nr:hypothetical protein [Patescibacteria group bacterium]
MKFTELRQQFNKKPLFDVRDVLNLEKDFHRQRLYDWQKKDLITKITHNFYVFNDKELSEEDLYFIANKIYSPSYISLEGVLYHYNLIPETVYQVTSVTTRKTRSLSSEIGDFSYRHVKSNLFFGYKNIKKDNFTYQLAEPEKAILDLLYLRSDIKNKKQLKNLRIKKDEFLEKIDQDRIREYLKRFSSNTLKKKTEDLLELINKND